MYRDNRMDNRRPKVAIMGAALLITEEVTSPWPSLKNNSVVGVNPCRDSCFAVLNRVKEVHVRITNFYERWIDNYLAFDFFTHFRMQRNTLQCLLLNIMPYFKRRINKGGAPAVPLEKCVLMTLWYLVKRDVICLIADRFNVANSTACVVINEICTYITYLGPKIITWPKATEATVVAQNFFGIQGFPNVIGAIDCCHITITAPAEQHESYLDRKFTHSIVLQAVCTAEKLFTNIFVGFPGAAHDARVLKESSLYKIINTRGKKDLFYDEYHLIGDSAYPCKTWLLTPYKRTGRLTTLQTKYNAILSTTRVKIENSFALLLGRWRILQHVNVYSVQKAVNIITACCILHNFCLLEQDFITCEHELELSDTYSATPYDCERSGVLKRDHIAHELQ